MSRYDKGSHKGEYVDPAIEYAWRAWCFVAAAKDAEVARLRQRVEELGPTLRELTVIAGKVQFLTAQHISPRLARSLVIAVEKSCTALRGEGGK